MRIKEVILDSLVRAAVSFYCMGLMLFLVFSNFAPANLYNKWNWLYYWWNELFGGGVLVWVVVYIKCSTEDRSIVAPVIFYSLIVFIWDISSSLAGIHINNPMAVAVLFIILLIVCYWLTLRSGNFADKWLSKHLFN